MEQTPTILHKPWESWAGTCGRCRGPWTTFCVGRRCLKGSGQFPYECAVCAAVVKTCGPIPMSFDVEAWAKIQIEHAPACVWAQSRDYRLTPSAA